MQAKTTTVLIRRIWDSYAAMMNDKARGGLGWTGDERNLELQWPGLNTARYHVLHDALTTLQGHANPTEFCTKAEVAAYLNGKTIMGKQADQAMQDRACKAMSY